MTTEEFDFDAFQLSFVFTAETARPEVWPIDNFPPNEQLLSKPVSRAFAKDIQKRGVMEPISIAILPDNTFMVVAGCRRIKAARLVGITQLMVLVKDMSLAEALAARSASNNQREENTLADVNTLAYYLNADPQIGEKRLAALMGAGLSRIRALLPMAKLPVQFLTAVQDGHISEATLAKLSKLEPEYVAEAIKIFDRKNAKYLADVTDGKIFATPPTLLSEADLKEIQTTRVQNTLANLPLPSSMQQSSVFGNDVLAQLGIQPEPVEIVEGYVVLFDDSSSTYPGILNYQMVDLDTASLWLEQEGPNMTNPRICKVVRN